MKRDAHEGGHRTNTASEPTGQPLGTAPPWRWGHLDYAGSGGDARHPSDHAEQAAARDLGMWIDRLTTGEQLALALQHPMAAYFAVPPPRGGNPQHGRHHLRPSDGAHPPRHHGPHRRMALCGDLPHGAYGGLQPGRNERTTLAMAPARSPAHPCGHAKAQHLGHPWIPGLPRTRLRPPAAAVPRCPAAPQAGGVP